MDLDTLRTDTRYLISPQLTSSEYPDVDLDRNLNNAYQTVLAWVVPIQGDWEISGDVIYNDLEDGVSVIDLPEDLIRIYKGEVMYETNGSFVPLNFISVQADQATVEGNATRVIDDASLPTAELTGDTLELRPTPTEDVVNGLKLWVQLIFDDLADGVNEIPALMVPVHRAITLLAAIDYAVAEEMEKKERALRRSLYGDSNSPEDTGVKGLVEGLYSVRVGTRRDQVAARRRSYK